MRRMVRGTETVLGDAAALDELFLSNAFETRCCQAHVCHIKYIAAHVMDCQCR